MGWVREKYTKSYFTGFSDDGTKLHYGVEGASSQDATLREFDVKNLDRINFKEAHVLEIGFGRGESIKYLMDKEISSYTGIDFALPAFELAKEYVACHGFSEVRLFCADALEFLKNQGHEIKQPVDIVVLLDVVEHIPRDELRQIMDLLKPYLANKAIIAINTPVYQFDNDVLAEGLDERNHINTVDHADFIEETKGMHCNKYSFISLSKLMKQCGFTNLTERQIYILSCLSNETCYEEIPSFRNLWMKTSKNGYPIQSLYQPDEHELAYIQEAPPRIIQCDRGILSGCKILGASAHYESYINEHYDLSNVIAKGDIVFDVGGYIGLSSLHFSKLVGNHGKVFCFEPNPANINRIQRNFSENLELSENIKLYALGLGKKPEVLKMLLSDDIEIGYSSASQLIKGGKTAIPHPELYEMGFYENDVKVECLDNFVKNTGIIPNFIKVDIEGAEACFLRGAVETLKNHSITLMIEVHSPLSAFYTLEILNTLGYSTHVLSELWGNRIEILAKAKEQDNTTEHELLTPHIQKFLDLHGAHKLKSIRENEKELLEQTQNGFEAAQGRLESIQAQLQDTQTQLQDNQAQYQDAQTQLQDSQAQLQGIQTQLQDTQAQLQGIQTQLQDTQAQLQGIQTQLQDTQAQLQDTQAQLQDTQAQLQDTQAQLQDTQARLQNNQNQLQDTQTQLQNKQAQFEGTQTQLQNTQNQFQDTQTQLQTMQSQFHETSVQLHDTQAQLQETQKQLNKYQNQFIIKHTRKIKSSARIVNKSAPPLINAIRLRIIKMVPLALNGVRKMRKSQ